MARVALEDPERPAVRLDERVDDRLDGVSDGIEVARLRERRDAGPRGGEIIGWASVVVCSFLVVLYLPGMPASISLPAWIMFGLWWLVGLIPFLRTPSVPPGPEVEDTVVELARRRRAGRADARSAEAAGRGSGA